MGKIFTGISLFFLFVFSSQIGRAQNPDWTDYNKRAEQYPEKIYLTGFISEPVSKSDQPQDVLRKLSDMARTQLIQSIKVNIRSTATLNLENLNTRSLEQFKQASTSFSEATLAGLKTETWYDKKKKEAFAFAFAKKSEIVNTCRSDYGNKSVIVKIKIENAEQLAATGDIENAHKMYLGCFVLLREMEQDVSMIVALEKVAAGKELPGYEMSILKAVAGLRKKPGLTLDDICFLMADGLNQQLQDAGIKVALKMGSFTFQDTRMGSCFSKRISATMEQKLIREEYAFVIEDAAQSADKGNEEYYLVNGTYWEVGDNLKIIANILSVNYGKKIASVEELLPKSWISDNDLSYLPDNAASALTLQKSLSRDEIKNTGIIPEVWTSKGADNPLFSGGDTMLLFIRVNKPCYVRFIYYLADGSKTLLLDNLYIGEDKVGKPYQIPKMFVCDSPYGSEIIQLIAQTEPFLHLNIQQSNGYDYITDDVGKVLANVRGMKKLNDLQSVAEVRLDITTIPLK